MARLDDAVRRILRVKIPPGPVRGGQAVEAAAGRQVRPARRRRAPALARAGRARVAGAAQEQRRPAAARRRQQGCWSPATAPTTSAKQAGGWTLTWQGDRHQAADFPNAESIWDGIRSSGRGRRRHGGACRSTAATATKPDVAIVVFGEDPYAEFQGDLPNLLFEDAPRQARRDLDSPAQTLKADGIPVVAVFLSAAGRCG